MKVTKVGKKHSKLKQLVGVCKNCNSEVEATEDEVAPYYLNDCWQWLCPICSRIMFFDVKDEESCH